MLNQRATVKMDDCWKTIIFFWSISPCLENPKNTIRLTRASLLTSTNSLLSNSLILTNYKPFSTEKYMHKVEYMKTQATSFDAWIIAKYVLTCTNLNLQNIGFMIIMYWIPQTSSWFITLLLLSYGKCQIFFLALRIPSSNRLAE